MAYSEAPAAPYFVESRNDTPLQSGFKPNVTVLSRKSTPTIARKDLGSGIQQLSLEDEEEDEDDTTKPKPLTAEERQLKAQREMEEKRRKYLEARERIMGSSEPASGSSSPRSSTPPSRGAERGKGRGRGAPTRDNKDSRPGSAASNTANSKGKQLYDPNYVAKPDSNYIQKETDSVIPIDQQIVRNPRGPDGSGRRGHGFVGRGGKDAWFKRPLIVHIPIDKWIAILWEDTLVVSNTQPCEYMLIES
jgi:hypothetical protein